MTPAPAPRKLGAGCLVASSLGDKAVFDGSLRKLRSPAAPELVARANMYRLCSRLLASEIDQRLYRRLAAPAAGSGWPGSPLIDPQIAALGERRALDELAVEFCRLFVGPEPVCAPYASTQRGEVMLGARAEGDVRQFIRRHGLDVALSQGIVVLAHDHLAVLLALLAHLHDRVARGDAKAWSASRDLVRQHLHPWATVTAGRIADNAALQPYRGTARLLSGLLCDEVEA